MDQINVIITTISFAHFFDIALNMIVDLVRFIDYTVHHAIICRSSLLVTLS